MGAGSDACDLDGAGWRLVPEGLEHDATGYFIERGALGARRTDGLWEWPLHMAEKAWCAPSAFRRVFLAALSAFGLETDPRLADSFALARGEREGRIAQPARDRFVHLGELCTGTRPAPARRQSETAQPESWRARPAEPARVAALSARG